jgi:hypothetical protein
LHCNFVLCAQYALFSVCEGSSIIISIYTSSLNCM